MFTVRCTSSTLVNLKDIHPDHITLVTAASEPTWPLLSVKRWVTPPPISWDRPLLSVKRWVTPPPISWVTPLLSVKRWVTPPPVSWDRHGVMDRSMKYDSIKETRYVIDNILTILITHFERSQLKDIYRWTPVMKRVIQVQLWNWYNGSFQEFHILVHATVGIRYG